MSEENKIFTRVALDVSGKKESLESLKAAIYRERYGVELQADLKKGEQARALDFSEKEVTSMDNWAFVFLTSDEVARVKTMGYRVQAFYMNTWGDL